MASDKIFTLNFDIRDLNELFDDLDKSLQKASVNALNVIGTKANRAAINHISSRFNIPKKDLGVNKPDDKIFLKRADVRRREVVFLIIIKKSRRGLWLYGAKQTPIGVTVTVKKRAKIVRGAFISTWKKGQPKSKSWVFVRDPRLRKYKPREKPKRGKSLKLRQSRRSLMGPSIAGLYQTRGIRNAIDSFIEDNFQGELDDQFERQFEKA